MSSRVKTILLYHPRTLHEDAYRYFYIPYSLLSLATSLDRSTYNIILVDANLRDLSDGDLTSIFQDQDILCVGISAMIGHQIRGGLSFSQRVREVTDVPIVWGGGAATMISQETLANPLVDKIVLGQGQTTFKELVEAIHLKGNIEAVSGIAFKTNGGSIRTSSRPFIDWSRYPGFQSTFDLVSVPQYIREDEHINTQTVNYHSSQGCPFNCGFCSEVALWQRRWGGFSAQTMISDIEYLVNQYGVNGVKFYDAEFFINRSRVLEFADLLVKRGLNIRWAAAVHPRNFDTLSDEEVILLVRSGLSRLLMGAESGIQDELNLIGKKTTPEMIARLAQRCSYYRIVACFSFVTGYPGFPVTHIQRTIEFAQNLRQIDANHECKVHLYGPYPGTPLYERATQYGFIAPESLEAWSYHDYYQVTTPWLPPEAQKWVRSFNEENYIYMNQLDS